MDETRDTEREPMKERRDTELGRRLEAFGEPDHGPEYWRDVRQAVAETKAEPTAQGAQRAQRAGLGRRLRAAFAPRWARLAFAVAAVVAVAAAVILAGLPGTRGPQTVSAAEVLRRALATYSSGRTWQTDASLRIFDDRTWVKWHVYATRRLRIVQAADGSERWTGSWVTAAGHRLPGGERFTEVFDSTSGTGVLRMGQPARRWAIETGQPLGPPDAGTVPLIDVGTAIRALATSTALRLDETTVGGRAAWTITCTKGELIGLPSSSTDWPIYTVTIDKRTSQLLRVQEVQEGRVSFDIRYHDIRVNEPLPGEAFTMRVPDGVPVARTDDGFRRVSLNEAAAAPGVAPLVPTFVPGGFRLLRVAVADRAVTTESDVVRGRHVFALQYSRGFDKVTVSTRRIVGHYSPEDDPVEEFDQNWSKLARTEATIASGPFAGVTARILVASTTSAPHLWAVKDGVLLVVAGAATADELMAVAESLRVYPGQSAAE